MFSFFKKIKETELCAPVLGKSLPLEKVPDPVFAEKMMGDGCAFVFEGDTVYAPCSGEIMLIANTKHAIGIRSENGAEILIHIGLDTVNLNGEGFDVLVKEHAKVKVHDPIIRINREFMKQKNIDLTMPMVITNMDDYELTINNCDEVDLHQVVIHTRKK